MSADNGMQRAALHTSADTERKRQQMQILNGGK